jgi:broad specificity phosphatase PhoE
MIIYLIRHGESTSDVENKYGGDYDDHLTKKGLEQAKNLTKKLKNKGIQKIFSSSRLRAKETAEMLGEAIGCELEIVDDLRERNRYGKLSGMNKDEAKTRYPDQVKLLNDFHNSTSDGEQFDDFRNRIEKSFNYIFSQNLNIMAVVSHGGPIICLLEYILKLIKIKELKDCALIELEKKKSNFKISDGDGMKI